MARGTFAAVAQRAAGVVRMSMIAPWMPFLARSYGDFRRGDLRFGVGNLMRRSVHSDAVVGTVYRLSPSLVWFLDTWMELEQ